jgi:hypothetical protein
MVFGQVLDGEVKVPLQRQIAICVDWGYPADFVEEKQPTIVLLSVTRDVGIVTVLWAFLCYGRRN